MGRSVDLASSGMLYDLIANGLKHEASVEEDGKAPRMIDNYQWFRACEMGTGLRLADRFRENYETLIREVAFETLTGKAVLAFMRDRRLTRLGRDARGLGCLAGHDVRTVRGHQAQVAGGLRRLRQAEEPPARLSCPVDQRHRRHRFVAGRQRHRFHPRSIQ